MIYLLVILLREARKKRGWSVRLLSDFSGVSKSQINDIEKGRVNPTLKCLYRLACAMEVSLESLYEIREDKD